MEISIQDLKAPPVHKSGRTKRRKRSNKPSGLKHFIRQVKKDPIKFIAYIAVALLLYVTVLFVKYDIEQDKVQSTINVVPSSQVSHHKK
jgi:hypothetical protein